MAYDDVFPRRNLPEESEEWGRAVEQRIRAGEYAGVNQKTNIKSENRTSASSLQELSRQLERLEDVVNSISVTRQTTAQNSGFGLGDGWNTVVTASIVAPSNAAYVRLLVVGSGQLVSTTNNTTVASSYRLVLNGVGNSAETPGAWFTGNGDFRTIMAPTWSWNFPVNPGATITVQFQVVPANSAAYAGGNPNSYAALSLLGSFTG